MVFRAGAHLFDVFIVTAGTDVHAGEVSLHTFGTGRLNNVPGATINFVLTDAGEPGNTGGGRGGQEGFVPDTIAVTIRDAAGATVLDCFATALVGGNHQAHRVTGRDAR